MKTISKKKVLSAIKNEPLFDGAWVESYIDEEFDCKVCAVGAVLRIAGLSNSEIGKFGELMRYSGPCSLGDKRNVTRAIRESLKYKQYLHALSLKYEYHSGRSKVKNWSVQF